MNRTYIALGAAVLVAIVLTLWMIPRLGSLGSREGSRYTVMLEEAAGLTEDNPVKLAGVVVGVVEAIEATGDGAEVTVRLAPEVELRADALAAVRATSLLGNKYLEIEAGSPNAARLDAGARIPNTRGTYEVDEALNALEPVFGPESIGAAFETLSTHWDALRRAGEDPEDPEHPEHPEDENPLETREDLEQAVNEIRDDVRSTRELVEEAQAELPTLIADANAALGDRRVDRTIGTIDRVAATTANRLPGLLDDTERALGRADSALAKVSDVTAEFTPARIAELDETLDEVVAATADLRQTSEDLQGIGDDIGPLIANLSTLARRAAGIDELTIRRFLQEEGFLTRFVGGEPKRAKRRIEELE